MAGAFSDVNMTPNRLFRKAEKLRDSGRKMDDLTCSNFTKHGEQFPEQILSKCLNGYLRNRAYEPDARGSLAAREEVAALYAGRGAHISPEHIFLTAGSCESYRLLFSLLCDVGDTILGPALTYPLFDIIAEDQRVHLDTYRLVLEQERWKLDAHSLDAKLHERCRAILSISPHNPTGMTLTDAVHPFGAVGLPIISDEVFSGYVWPEDCDGLSVSPPVGTLFPRLPVFHLDGVSKGYCLPDMKVSWIAMNTRAYELVGERMALLNDSYLTGSPLTQTVLTALREPSVAEFQHRVRARIRRNIDYALATIRGAIRPQGGSQLMIRVAEDDELLAMRLLDEGVLVHPGHFYGADSTAAYIVISCVPDELIFMRGAQAIARALERVHDKNH